MLWIYGGNYQAGRSGSGGTDGVLNIGSLETPLVIVTFNYRENVFGFAASSHLRSRDPAGGTGNYGLLDQRFAMQWVQKNIGRFGGDPTRVFLVGQSAGADSVAQHLVRQNSWGGLFHAAGLESGAFYQLQPPTSHDSSCGPTPGNVTVAQQEGRWAAMMARLGCGAPDNITCALTVPAKTLMELDPNPNRDCGWMPAIDGVDLTAPLALLAASGQMAKVPIVAGGLMEDATIVFPSAGCAATPATCSKADFKQWAADGFGLNTSQAAQLAGVYADEQVRTNLTDPATGKMINGSAWYWAQVHAGADAQTNCPARRAVSWAAAGGQPSYWYYWEYPPKMQPSGVSSEAVHCGELTLLWADGCTPGDTAGKPWRSAECAFGLKFAAYWASFAAHGNPSDGAVQWPAYVPNGSGSGASAMIMNNDMSFSVSKNHRASRCDFWDAQFPRLW